MENEITIAGVALSVVLIGVVQALKATGALKPKFAGIVSIALGTVVGVVYALMTDELSYGMGALHGLVAGVVASGVYSNVKNLFEVDRY